MGGRQPVRDEKKLRGGALTVMQKQPMLGVCQFYREPEDKHAENKKCTQQLNVHLQKDDTNASLFSSRFTLFAYTHDTEQSTTTICCQSTTFRLWNPSQLLTNGKNLKYFSSDQFHFSISCFCTFTLKMSLWFLKAWHLELMCCP